MYHTFGMLLRLCWSIHCCSHNHNINHSIFHMMNRKLMSIWDTVLSVHADWEGQERRVGRSLRACQAPRAFDGQGRLPMTNPRLRVQVDCSHCNEDSAHDAIGIRVTNQTMCLGHKDVRVIESPLPQFSVRVEPSSSIIRPRGYLDATGLMMETTRVESSPGVTLSVRVFRPTSNATEKPVTLVLVHQYSLMGGCQELLRGMAYRLAAKGFTTVTFDMRGVGTSTGKPTLTGASEIHDVVAVCQWAAKHCTAPSILLVGSSAGAPIAGAAIDSVKEVVGYTSLGYPFGLLASVLFGRHNKACLQSPKPKMFVMGTNDGFTTVKQLESKLKSAAGRVEKRLVRGAGHFEMEGPQYDDQMVEYLTTFADSLQPVSS